MGADGASILAVGFGRTTAEAAYHALTSSMSPFETILNDYSSGWRAWQSCLRTMERYAHGQNIYRVSANILRVHEAPTFPGGFIASLSIPWGFSKGDDDMGGYHLVWPRDLCETGGALLACGAHSEVRRILRYLRATQEGDGSWRQNYWLDGTSYWSGVQLRGHVVDRATEAAPARQPWSPSALEAITSFGTSRGPLAVAWRDRGGQGPHSLWSHIGVSLRRHPAGLAALAGLRLMAATVSSPVSREPFA